MRKRNRRKGKEEIIKREEELKKKKAAAAAKKEAAAAKEAVTAEKKAAAGKKKATAEAEKRGATAVRNKISSELVIVEGNETFAESEETRKWPMSSYTLRRKQGRLDSDAPLCSTTMTTSNNVSTML